MFFVTQNIFKNKEFVQMIITTTLVGSFGYDIPKKKYRYNYPELPFYTYIIFF
jgi:hypothetical protein